MARYIFRFRGHTDGNGYSDEFTPVDALSNAIKVTDADAMVIDKASTKMALVEADTSTVAELRRTLPDWIITPEHSVPLPDTRKKAKGDLAGAGLNADK